MPDTYGLLQPQDYESFSEKFNAAFGRYPDLGTVSAIVGKDETGEIFAFVGLYNIVVADSMWVAPERRHKGIWRRLIDGINRLPWKPGSGYYLFASRGREDALAKVFDGTPLRHLNVWAKRF